MAFWVFGCPESDFTAQLARASVYQAHSLLCVPRLAVSVGARRGEASRRGAVWVQGRCIAELCEPCFVSLCLFIAGEELFQSFREPAAKLYFLPRPCSRREASQPNGGRACQAACAPAWVTLSCLHTQTHTHKRMTSHSHMHRSAGHLNRTDWFLSVFFGILLWKCFRLVLSDDLGNQIWSCPHNLFKNPLSRWAFFSLSLSCWHSFNFWRWWHRRV